MAVLVSFDIDGTLEVGDPPGPITMEMVRRAQAHGCIVGSSSDRTLREQQEIWDQQEIQTSFVSLKHRIAEVKTRFEAERYYHIGDTDLDQQFALRAGFDFLWTHEGHTEPWIRHLTASAPPGE